ncbi:hypothetical protein ACFSSG_11275 [Euzebyella marina]|uniref:hypothetical protein n=1 Tax=Euzebyella marina TaxID=1761453 RepID=UPI0013CF365C|nr:hypothetical protein [Euzebyella marina]
MKKALNSAKTEKYIASYPKGVVVPVIAVHPLVNGVNVLFLCGLLKNIPKIKTQK